MKKGTIFGNLEFTKFGFHHRFKQPLEEDREYYIDNNGLNFEYLAENENYDKSRAGNAHPNRTPISPAVKESLGLVKDLKNSSIDLLSLEGQKSTKKAIEGQNASTSVREAHSEDQIISVSKSNAESHPVLQNPKSRRSLTIYTPTCKYKHNLLICQGTSYLGYLTHSDILKISQTASILEQRDNLALMSEIKMLAAFNLPDYGHGLTKEILLKKDSLLFREAKYNPKFFILKEGCVRLKKLKPPEEDDEMDSFSVIESSSCSHSLIYGKSQKSEIGGNKGGIQSAGVSKVVDLRQGVGYDVSGVKTRRMTLKTQKKGVKIGGDFLESSGHLSAHGGQPASSYIHSSSEVNRTGLESGANQKISSIFNKTKTSNLALIPKQQTPRKPPSPSKKRNLVGLDSLRVQTTENLYQGVKLRILTKGSLLNFQEAMLGRTSKFTAIVDSFEAVVIQVDAYQLKKRFKNQGIKIKKFLIPDYKSKQIKYKSIAKRNVGVYKQMNATKTRKKIEIFLNDFFRENGKKGNNSSNIINEYYNHKAKAKNELKMGLNMPKNRSEVTKKLEKIQRVRDSREASNAPRMGIGGINQLRDAPGGVLLPDSRRSRKRNKTRLSRTLDDVKSLNLSLDQAKEGQEGSQITRKSAETDRPNLSLTFAENPSRVNLLHMMDIQDAELVPGSPTRPFHQIIRRKFLSKKSTLQDQSEYLRYKKEFNKRIVRDKPWNKFVKETNLQAFRSRSKSRVLAQRGSEMTQASTRRTTERRRAPQKSPLPQNRSLELNRPIVRRGPQRPQNSSFSPKKGINETGWRRDTREINNYVKQKTKVLNDLSKKYNWQKWNMSEDDTPHLIYKQSWYITQEKFQEFQKINRLQYHKKFKSYLQMLKQKKGWEADLKGSRRMR